MKKKTRIITSLALVIMLLAISFVVSPSGAQLVQAQGPVTVVYNIYATDGWWTMADGTVLYGYGYVGGRAGQPFTYLNKAGQPITVAGGPPAPTGGQITATEMQFAGNAQFPGPLIYCNTGDTVQINFKNLGVTVRSAPNDPHTIHLHGLDVDAANDGVPETSVAAVPANTALPGAGNVIVYMFHVTQPGTYMYHCHQEADIHVTMGMYGALVVYNPTDAAAATGPGMGAGGKLWGHTYSKDYVLLLSETDVLQHKAEQTGGNYNPVNFLPQYWFMNCLSFPNTIHAGVPPFNFANWILAHPGYDPFIVGSIDSDGQGGPDVADKVLVRMINLGFQAQPIHYHGFHAKVIGSDQRAWPWANESGVHPLGAGLEKNTILIGSGETYELLFDFAQQNLTSTYQAGTQTRYDPVSKLPVVNDPATSPAIPDPFVPGFAYVGGKVVGPDSQASQGPGGLPPALPFVSGQYFPMHNHDDYKATNNGVYPGGMFTLILTVP